MIPTSPRSLRFPPEMEAEFQRRYHLRAGKNTQMVMILGAMIYLIGSAWGDNPWYLILLGLLGPAGGWILCEIKAFHKYAQTVGALGYVCFFVVLDLLMKGVNASYEFGYLTFVPIINVFVLYTMVRMFLIPSTVSAVCVSIAHLYLLHRSGAGGDVVENAAIGLVFANVIGFFTSFQFERNFRRMFSDKESLTREHAVQERLLENILPRDIGEKLRNNFQDVVIECPDVIVISADLANFTAYSSTVSAGELVAFLNEIYTEFDALADRYKMTKIKTMGDAVILANGIHGAANPSACMKMAVSMRSVLHAISAKHRTGIDIRIGIARGPCSAGVVGELRPKFDIWGPAVEAAEKMEKQARNGSIALDPALRAGIPNSPEYADMISLVDQTAENQLRAI